MSTKKIIIIGATSGIGRELAILYLKQGHHVGITGRRESLLQELKQLYPSQVHTSCFDVTATSNISSLQNLVEQMQGLDLFIYNSGYGDVSKELDHQIESTTVKTNVTAFVDLVSFAFNYFVNKGHGQIAVISSIAALRGNSWAPAYSASKAFISNYAEGLNIKATRMKKNIIITDIKPGFVDTKLAKGNKRFWMATTTKAAAQIQNAIDNKKRIAHITKRWWIIAGILRILPFSIYRRLV